MAVNRTYGNITYNKGKDAWIITGAEPHVCIKLKAVFNGIPKGDFDKFNLANTLGTCADIEWFMKRYPLKISDSDFKLLVKNRKKFEDDVNRMEAILLPEYTPRQVSLKSGCAGRHYQLAAKDLYMLKKRLLIGDDLGLGKTVTAILSFLEPGTLPVCVIGQTHMPNQWKLFVERFTDLKVHLIKGTKPYDLPKADVYIGKYTQLSGWVDVFSKGIFKSAVFDEVQELRCSDSQKYNAAKALSQNVEYCMGLSASPIYNFGEEIFNVLNVINPGCLGSAGDFFREWVGYKHVKDPQALGTFLRENFLMLRRTRAEVGMELPPVNRIVYTVGYDSEEVKESHDLAKQLALRVTTGSFMERGDAARQLDLLLRKTTGISKAKDVAAFVRILLENKEPVILAGWHRRVYEIWLKELAEFNPVMYTGSESPAQKQKSIDTFVEGKTNLFILSLRSGVGIDGLQKRTKTVVFGELDWSPKVHDQLIARADGDGQPDQVTAFFLISEFGSDPVMVDLLGVKSSESHNIMDPMMAVPDKHTDESRIKLLAESYLKKNA